MCVKTVSGRNTFQSVALDSVYIIYIRCQGVMLCTVEAMPYHIIVGIVTKTEMTKSGVTEYMKVFW